MMTVKYTANLILGMKHCYLDKFKQISFLVGRVNYFKQNLYNYEHWIINNVVVRLEHFSEFKWKYDVVNSRCLSDISVYEVADVELIMKRKQPTEEE